MQDEIEQLQLAKDKVESEIKTNQTNNQLLSKMEGFATVTTVQTTEKGNLNSEAAINTTKFIMEARMKRRRNWSRCNSNSRPTSAGPISYNELQEIKAGQCALNATLSSSSRRRMAHREGAAQLPC